MYLGMQDVRSKLPGRNVQKAQGMETRWNLVACCIARCMQAPLLLNEIISSGLCRLEQDVGMAVSIPGSKLGQRYKNYTCASDYEVPRPLRNSK